MAARSPRPARSAPLSALATAAKPAATCTLAFAGDARARKHPIHNISACAAAGDALFLAADEEPCLERMTRQADGSYGDHRRFPLRDLLDLDDPDEEADIEGLAVRGDWLWLTGSHSRTRYDPHDDGEQPDRIAVAKFADLKDTRPRCVVARIPLITGADGQPEPVRRDGKRRAGLIAQKGKHGSKLAALLAKDPLIGPSTRLAAKEGGLDIEGIAVADGARVLLGLRGPVLQTFAVLLDLALDPRKSGKLALARKLCMRLLDLRGLGIRDLRCDGGDLLILAGPTQDLDGRCSVFRWRDWAAGRDEDAETVCLHRPERMFDLPITLGADHAEGIEIVPPAPGKRAAGRRLLVVYDSPAKARIDENRATLTADLFKL